MKKYLTYQDLFRKLYNEGKITRTKDQRMTELIDCNIVINKYNLYYHYLHRPFDRVFRYLLGELSWYFSGENTIKHISEYSVFWKKIENNNHTINSNYGRLVFYKQNRHHITQFNWIIKQLRNDINSRQAIILYSDKDYYYDENRDFVCTQLHHFFIRDNLLISIVYVRSSDIILGLTYDIPWWSIVQQMIFLRLKRYYKDLKIGKMIVHGGSFHFYPNKNQLIRNIMLHNKKLNRTKIFLKKEIPLNKDFKWYEKNIVRYLDIHQDKNNQI